jgi:hypothetical protein
MNYQIRDIDNKKFFLKEIMHPLSFVFKMLLRKKLV